jgi:hypothetical protein
LIIRERDCRESAPKDVRLAVFEVRSMFLPNGPIQISDTGMDQLIEDKAKSR